MRLKPNLWALGQNFVSSEHPSRGPCFYVNDFFLEETKPFLLCESYQELSDHEFFQFLQSHSPENDSKAPRDWQKADLKDFEYQVQLFQGSLKAREVKKVIASTFESSRGQPSEGEFFKLARNCFRADRATPYGLWTEEGFGFVGVTPELLFQIKQNRLLTLALAGTAHADGPDLLQNPKERDEHQWVIDDLRERLEDLGLVTLSPTYEWKLSLVKHLRTDIAVELNARANFSECVVLLHPSAAIGGYPREKALKLQRIFRRSTPKYFAAPFGVLNSSEGECCWITIRGLLWLDGKSFLASGCGLVEGSVLEKEWAELELKRQSVKNTLGLNA